jgi:photosystem II stability/assembly factor-like uncharacterized protein
VKQKLIIFFSIFFITFGSANVSQCQWVQTNGYFSSWPVSFLAASGANLFAGSDMSGVYCSTDYGSDWTLINSSFSMAGYFFGLAANDSNVFVGTDVGIYCSTDVGTNWDLISASPVDVTAFMVNDANVFAGTYSEGVFLSIDGGVSWKSANEGFPNAQVRSFARIDTNIFAGTDSGIFLTTNNGATWAAVNNGLTTTFVFAVTTIGTNLFAGTYNPAKLTGGAFRSTDNGASWVRVDSSMDVYSFAVSGTRLFAGSFNRGVFLSTDSGTTWIDENTGLADSAVFSLLVSGADIFAGTDASNVWRCPLSDFSISSVAQAPAATSPQIQSYPNPFPQSTQISFTSESAGYADVSVVNLLGAEVAGLFDGVLSPGEHQFLWDATGTPPGMYECVIRMNGNIQHIPLLVVR